MNLRGYQMEALQAIKEAYRRGVRKQIVNLPTGCGKTIIFSALRGRSFMQLDSRMLILVHREELVQQAKDKMHAMHDWVNVSLEKAKDRPHFVSGHAVFDDLFEHVVIASVASLSRDNRLSSYQRDAFSVIVVDECHHATAASYQKILDYFDGANVIVGVTATPFRSDGVDLAAIFDEIVYRAAMPEMIDSGWLVPIRGYRVSTGVDISGVKTSAGDFQIGMLSAHVNTEDRNAICVKAYRDISKEGKAIVFCVDVAHSHAMASIFQAHGYKAASVWGDMDVVDRKETLSRFANGELRVLTNCALLTEGFDEPSIDTVIMARPTKSSLLYAQMLGRGTRLHGTANYLDDMGYKENLKCIDVTDSEDMHKAIRIGDLFGIGDLDIEGRDVNEAQKTIREILTQYPGLDLTSVDTISNLEEIVMNVEDVSLYIPKIPEEVLQCSSFSWVKLSYGEYRLSLLDGEHLVTKENAMGKYEVTAHIGMQNEDKTDIVGWVGIPIGHPLMRQQMTFRESIRAGDAWVQEHKTSQQNMVSSNAHWRQKPASEKQMRYLARLGVKVGGQHLTSGEVNILIDRAQASKPSEPATSRQLWRLRQLGVVVNGSMSKHQATSMIRKKEGGKV